MNILHSNFYKKIGGSNRNVAIVLVIKFGPIHTKAENQKMVWCVKTENGPKIERIDKLEEQTIAIPAETQWILESREDKFFTLHVTEKTKYVKLPLENWMVEILNQKVKSLQEEYQEKKKKEKRLYFYRARTGELKLYVDGKSYWSDDGQYSLVGKRCLQELDERFPVPKEDCYVLGRVSQTIVTKKGLLDFIEPIARFVVDPEEKWNFLSNQPSLGRQLFEMLKFSIQKTEPSELIKKRIRNKTQKTVSTFLKELKDALEAGDAKKVKAFYDVVTQMQNCETEKFCILEEMCQDAKTGSKIVCEPTRELWLHYENGEQEKK